MRHATGIPAEPRVATGSGASSMPLAIEPQTTGFLALPKGKPMQEICEPTTREIDLSTAPAFAAAMRTEIDWAHDRTVFIDCSAITFMDSSALHALTYAHRYAIEHDHLLVIGNLQPSCARVVNFCNENSELRIRT